MSITTLYTISDYWFKDMFSFSSVKRAWDYNNVHNILRPFDGLANFLFPTSETKCNYEL